VAPIVPLYDPQTGYDETKLEFLYYEVFQSRGINLTPISLIPYYLDLYFRMTSAPSPVTIPVPEEYPHPVRKKNKYKYADASALPQQQPSTTENSRAASGSSPPAPSSTENTTPNGRCTSPPPPPMPGEFYIVEPMEINTGSGFVMAPRGQLNLTTRRSPPTYSFPSAVNIFVLLSSRDSRGEI
jgi:hypothetical protein